MTEDLIYCRNCGTKLKKCKHCPKYFAPKNTTHTTCGKACLMRERRRAAKVVLPSAAETT